MGMSGSDVAQEAASVVILNDDFFSLLKVVSWGRCINDSIRKFIQFQLSVTGAALGVVALSTIFYSEQILNPLQILWINLYMDSFSALSLSTDQPTNQLFLRSPESVNTPIITNYMKLFMASTVLYQYLVMIVLILFGISKTFIFNTFFFLQIFNQINARSIDVHRSPFSAITANKIYLLVNIISVILQIIIVQKLGIVFGTEPLSFGSWSFSIFIALLIIPFFEIIRNLEKRRVKKTVKLEETIHSTK
ncbi:Plasma membrane calcium-transporting ATPase [Spraguea lophii 42_110]|uniref:Plasma membrane calcium-transporting ATPase n=1 Tax=Spraguea lophii (strain 42_110) TaxID=1358809 RepID=S7XQR8_SPRLO|nr:Plasma membrane calcium-transporting ATPase [Spraguea lophii 42_110]